MAIWPASFPQPRIDGYRVAPDDGVLRTDMESGAPRARRVATLVGAEIDVVYVFPTDLLFDLQSWWVGVAQLGAAEIDMDLPFGGGWQAVRARFAQPYESRPLNTREWEVSARIKVAELPALPADLAGLYFDIGEAALAGMELSLHTLVHVTLPLYLYLDSATPQPDAGLQTEAGFWLLLEDGGYLLQEAANQPFDQAMLLENGSDALELESGDLLLLEAA